MPAPEKKHFTKDDIRSRFKNIAEFKDLELDDTIAEYIAKRLNRISDLEYKINEMLMHYGAIDAPVKIRFGSEFEFYNVAGEESYDKRLDQLCRIRRTRNPAKRGKMAMDAVKDDSYMPQMARAAALNAAFDSGLEHGRHVEVHKEGSHKERITTSVTFSEDGKKATTDRIALFQHEIVSPPRSAEGLAFWLPAIAQRIIDRAPQHGLKRSEIITVLPNIMPSSSLHFHMSVMGTKDGKEFNLLARDSFAEEKKRQKKNDRAVSQLALHIGQAMNDFLKDYIYIFAPTKDAYERFSDRNFVGTSFIGFGPRKERFNMGSAIFRGAGRECFRPEDTAGKPDGGPLRIELRVPDVGCIGHPNKRAYPDQMMAPFDVAEAMMYMLYKGVEGWAKQRDDMLQHRPFVPKTEEALYEQRYPLPPLAGTAATDLKNAQRKNKEYLTTARAEIITKRGFRQQAINDLDRKPNLPPGQTQDRSKQIPHWVR